MDAFLVEELIAKPFPDPPCRNSIPSGLVQSTNLDKRAPPVDCWGAMTDKSAVYFICFSPLKAEQ